jgi:hypothetical protein
LATKEEDGRAPRAAVGGDAACGNPIDYAVTSASALNWTPSSVTPVFNVAPERDQQLPPIATMAIRRVRPCNVPTRSRNHAASALPGW